MSHKLLPAALIGAALIVMPAMAENSKDTQANTQESASASGLWQASKLIGLDVYNNQNQKIGDIKQLMVSKSGKIDDVVIGVGGFLGMGQRDVAVKFGELKWSNEPVRNSSASNKNNATATTGSNNGNASGNATYPDHALFNASKDQLKAMPQFNYNK